MLVGGLGVPCCSRSCEDSTNFARRPLFALWWWWWLLLYYYYYYINTSIVMIVVIINHIIIILYNNNIIIIIVAPRTPHGSVPRSRLSGSSFGQTARGGSHATISLSLSVYIYIYYIDIMYYIYLYMYVYIYIYIYIYMEPAESGGLQGWAQSVSTPGIIARIQALWAFFGGSGRRFFPVASQVSVGFQGRPLEAHRDGKSWEQLSSKWFITHDPSRTQMSRRLKPC